MKIKIIFLSIFLFFGCSDDKKDYTQISTSKSTAISNAIKLASPGVVGIYKYQDVIKKDLFFRRYQDRIRSIGSGFLISQDGYIITNAHNIELENYETTGFKVTVVLPGGEVYDAEFRGVDVTTDIALLKIEGNNFEYCNMGDSDGVNVGEWAIALGNPSNLISKVQYQPIASAGIISAINVDLNFDRNGVLLDNMIQTDAAINPGNSGGPLIDSNGKVIGMNTYVYEGENLGFAIPINFVKKIANELKLRRVIDRRVSFGFFGRKHLYGNEKNQIGYLIDKVDYNDSARNEELYRGDIIVAVEGLKIESLEEINLVLIKLDVRAGDEIELTVLRENSFKDVKITLGKIWQEEV